MPKFNEMDPSVVKQLISNQPNILKDLEEKELERLKTVKCPNCSSYKLQTSIDPKNPFSSGSVLPNKLFKCLSCWHEFTL